MNSQIRKIIVLTMLTALLLTVATETFAQVPDCTQPEAWPASMAITYMKNAGIVTGESLDFGKTRVIRIASEKVGDDLYRQVHLIRFTRKSGERISVITVSDASIQECSMSDVTVYIVSERLADRSAEKNR